MGWIDERAQPGNGTAAAVASCAVCHEPMPANARFCGSCGTQRRVGGPADGEEVTPSGIIVVSTGGRHPVSHALTDPTEEVMVIDEEGRATLEVKPAPEPAVIDLNEGDGASPDGDGPPVAAEPQVARTWPQRLRTTPVLVAAAVAVLALVATVAVVAWPDGGPQVDVNAPLATGAETAQDTLTAFSEAEVLADLAAAGETALAEVDTYEGRIDALAEVGDDEVREAAVSLLGAEQDLVEAYGQTFVDYAPPRFRLWEDREARMQQRLDRVEEAQADLVALEREELTARFDVDRARDQLTSIGRMVEDKRDTFRDWVRERNAALGAQAAASFGLQAYAEPMRGLIADYGELREDLADWTVELDRRVVYVSEALLVLSEATNDRRAIANQMRSLQPPPAMAATHASLVGILDEATSALESAYEGINLYLFDPFWAYTDVRQTPGWTTFSVASDRITGSLDSAIAAWESARAAEQQRISSSIVPERPEL